MRVAGDVCAAQAQAPKLWSRVCVHAVAVVEGEGEEAAAVVVVVVVEEVEVVLVLSCAGKEMRVQLVGECAAEVQAGTEEGECAEAWHLTRWPWNWRLREHLVHGTAAQCAALL